MKEQKVLPKDGSGFQQFLILIFALVIAGGIPLRADPLTLVEDAQAKAVIVVQPVINERQVALDEFTFPGRDNVPPRQWAETLQTYIERITGAKLPIVENRKDANGPAIHVGLTDFVAGLKIPFAKYDRDTIILRRVGDQVALVGVDDWGSEMAVYDFLERVCGVRWYQPSELWEVVPSTKIITVGELNVVEEPSFKSRMFSGVLASGMPTDVWKEGWTWLKRNRMRVRYTFHHKMRAIFDPAIYGKTHPEYFPYLNGKHHVPTKYDRGGWQPCYSHPGVIKACVDAAREFFDEFPAAIGFSMGQNDMFGFCECDSCQKANAGAGYHELTGKRNYSPVYFTFLNKVCEELTKTHPEKKLGCLIYASGTSVPPPFDLHPNIAGYVQPNDISRYHFDERFREWTDEQFETWSKKLKTIGVYTWRHGRTVYIPKLELKSFEEYLKMTYQHGARGYYGEEYPNWGLDAPKTYITSRLLWNVEDSADALLSDFCTKSFKEAAAPMRKFYDLLERTWNEQSPYDAPIISGYMQGRREQFSLYTPAVVGQARGFLEHALQLAKDEKVLRRIRHIKKCFRLTEYYALREFTYSNMEIPDSLTPTKFAELIAGLNSMQHITYGIEALIYGEYQDDFYSFYQGLIHNRQYPNRRPMMAGMDFYYYQMTSEVVGNLVRSQVRKGRQQTQREIGAALSSRIDEVTKLMMEKEAGEGQGLSRSAIEVEPAWSIVKERLDHYVQATAVVARMEKAPAIDGVADEAEWANTPVLELTHNLSPKGRGIKIKNKTRVRVGYDDEAIYIGYVCEDDVANLVVRYDQKDSAVWRDDSIDFVLLPATVSKDDFYHFIVNSVGACWDGIGQSKTWNGDQRVAVGKNRPANTWTVEVAIPWPTLGRKPVSGEIWRAQFGRTNTSNTGGRVGDMDFSGWSPSDAGFNNADSLGILLFE